MSIIYNYRLVFLMVVFLQLLSGKIMSQSTANVFINCATTETRCYRDYLFQTLSNCNFVWDANNADVQILVSEKQNSQGGFRINFEFTGMKTLFGKKDTLWFDLPQGQTEEFIRTNIVQQISKGLNYLFHHTIFAQSFDIKPLAILKTEPKPNQAQQHDPWNLWNFTASVEGYIEGQSNYLFYNIEPKFTARKITPKHKWVLNIQQGFKQNSYTINEEKQSILVKSLDIIPLYAGSINEHWSWGAMIHYRTNEYVNLKSSVRIAPIIEYNIFPYSKNLVKQMRLAYQIGLQKQRYLGETIYEKLEETLPYQRLALLTDITRNWGSIRGTVQSSSFLNDLQKNRLSFSSEFSFRLAKGLFFNVNGQFEIINDQISLLKKPLADDVYLLGGQQLATKNNFWGEFGLTYTFGSKYNSIVNPRMGYLDEVWFQNK